jgi:hypothetical protein
LGVEPVSTEHHGSEEEINTNNEDGVVSHIPENGPSIFVDWILCNRLIASFVVIAVEPANEIVHRVTKGASNNPGNNGHDHKEHEVLNSLDGINWVA